MLSFQSSKKRQGVPSTSSDAGGPPVLPSIAAMTPTSSWFPTPTPSRNSTPPPTASRATKYGTMPHSSSLSALGGHSDRSTSARNLFGNHTNDGIATQLSSHAGTLFVGAAAAGLGVAPAEVDENIRDLQGLRKEDENWEISLAEKRKPLSGRKERPREKKIFTIYVSTPTSALTLTRTLQQLIDMEARLRAQAPSHLPPLAPASLLPSSELHNAISSPSKPRRSTSNILSSLSRTLTRRTPPASPNLRKVQLPISTTPNEIDTSELGVYLSGLSRSDEVRSSQAWRRFFRIGADDLESQRVERRVKRARSDLGMNGGGAVGGLATPTLSAAGDGGCGGLTNGSEVEMDTDPSSSHHHDDPRGSLPSPSTSDGGHGRFPSSSPSQDLSQPSHSQDPSLSTSVESVDVLGRSPVDPHRVTPEPAESPAGREEGLAAVVLQEVTLSDLTRRSKTIMEEEAGVLFEDLQDPDGVRRDASATTTATHSSNGGNVMDLPTPTLSQSAVEDEDSLGPANEVVKKASSRRDLLVSPWKTTRGTSVTMDDFECMSVLGKGCAGKVLLVRKKATGDLYALKAIHKHHVLAHRELDHTRTEQSVLKRCSRGQSNPFVVRLHYSFHDKETLYLALDFHPGGDLATQLARWGRLGRDRTRFYTAEIVEGVEGLHRAGVIYRDLKPENILISEAGHVVLTDFGLSKDFGHTSIPPSSAEDQPDEGGSVTNADGLPLAPHWMKDGQRSRSSPPSGGFLTERRETTATFCGTAEYLAPEVLLGEAYSYEVDSWSLGTMLYEMLAGVTPFWSEDHSTMYRRVLHEELAFEDDSRHFDDDTKSMLRGLLQKNPLLRMTLPRVKKHPYFSMIDWSHVFYKRYVPPFIPTLDPLNPTDTSQFDETYTNQQPTVANDTPADGPGMDRDEPEGEPQAAFDETGSDVFDGYSYFGGRDADSIVGVDEDESGDEDEEEVIEVVQAPIEDTQDQGKDVNEHEVDATDVIVDATLATSDVDLDLTASSLASEISTPATSVAHPSPVVARCRARSSGLDSLPESPIGSQEHMLVESHEDIRVVPIAEEPSDDDDWDVIDSDVRGIAHNGANAKGRNASTTLFARGVKDGYRLLVNVGPRAGGLSPSRLVTGGGSRFTYPHSLTRKNSSASGQSSLHAPSPSRTSEPRNSKLMRLSSSRSAGSPKTQSPKPLKASMSSRSLKDTTSRTVNSGAPTGMDYSTESLGGRSLAGGGTPKKAGQTIKRLASVFLSPGKA